MQIPTAGIGEKIEREKERERERKKNKENENESIQYAKYYNKFLLRTFFKKKRVLILSN